MMVKRFFVNIQNSSFFSLTVLFLCLQLFYVFPDATPTVATFSISSNNPGDTLHRTLNDLIFSFLKDDKSWKILDYRSQNLPSPLTVPANIDYIFFGSIETLNQGIKVELVLTSGTDFLTRTISKVYENSNKALLDSRTLVRDLFDFSIVLPSNDQQNLLPDLTLAKDTAGDGKKSDQAVSLISVNSLDSLTGNWLAEQGIEKVMIFRGGRGVAVLSSGISISLELLIAGEFLVVRQKSPLMARQFSDLPDQIAKQAVSIIPPLEWKFKKTPDSSILIGQKKTTTILHDGKNILNLESVMLNVEWHRE